MLNPADDAFATHLRTTIGADILRPLAPHYLQEPRGHWQGGGWAGGGAPLGR